MRSTMRSNVLSSTTRRMEMPNSSRSTDGIHAGCGLVFGMTRRPLSGGPSRPLYFFADATSKVNVVVVDYDNNYKDNRELPSTNNTRDVATTVASEFIIIDDGQDPFQASVNARKHDNMMIFQPFSG